MKKLILLFISLLYFTYGVQSQSKKICITIDDLPVVGISDYDLKVEVTNQIVTTLNEFEVPAIGYVNERKLYNDGLLDSAEVALLQIWLKNGLELGNHSFSHANYHDVGYEVFTEDILNGEQVIKPLSMIYGQEVRFFRHPYLRSGATKGQSDSLKVFLAEHGYTEAPVTVDNADYLFASKYLVAYRENDEELMNRITSDYVNFMKSCLEYYESQSEKLFGRDIAQTLLIHANLLNAHHLDMLLDLFKDRGYTFVSQEDVLKDNAYDTEITRFGNWGISWIDRWALSAGKKGSFFADEPVVPEYIAN